MTNRKRNRRSIRLEGFDYALAGAYFVTVCTANREMVFEDANLRNIVEEEWTGLSARFPSVVLDSFVVMPNHLHFVIWLSGVGAYPRGRPNALSLDNVPSRAGASPAPTLGAVVGAFKSRISVRWLKWVEANEPSRSDRVWQRNYYERVIRDDEELNRVREYIQNNPLQWQFDKENPSWTPDAAYARDWGWLEGLT